MTDSRPQAIDPAVSRTKFEREIAEYRTHVDDYRRRGWLLLEVDFPRVLVAMAAPQLRPPAIVTGVLFDYTDYDAVPPSVRLVDPFTGEPYRNEDLLTRLMRAVPAGPVALPPGIELPPGAMAQAQVHQPLVQCHEGGLPFLCVAGVREYHEHPRHTNDPWEPHRTAGAGRLVRILEIVDTYGIRPISGYNITLTPTITGWSQSEVPA